MSDLGRAGPPERCGTVRREQAKLPSGVGECYVLLIAEDGEVCRCPWWDRLQCVDGFWVCKVHAAAGDLLDEMHRARGIVCRLTQLGSWARETYCRTPYRQGALL